MITHFHIENFRSLANFDLPPGGHELGGFTCLIGMNGAGKTTLLQAFDFTAHLMSGSVVDWVVSRGWDAWDLRTKFGSEGDIRLSVALILSEGRRARWDATYAVEGFRCVEETVSLDERELLKLQIDGSLRLMGRNKKADEFQQIPFEFQGSILSSLRLEGYAPELKEVKEMILGLHSLELLSPHLIRRSSRASEDVGPGGERLAGFLFRLNETQRKDLLEQLRHIYPQVTSLQIQKKPDNLLGLLVKEQALGEAELTEANLNDGFLRVLVMLSQAYDTQHSILLLDEIENGINPAVVDNLMKFLVSLGHGDRQVQVIVTTHSPVILNYLDDDVAREGVILLYKTPDGRTLSKRYFDVPENAVKLRALGPGEVFLDTSIEALVDRLLAAEDPTTRPA